MTTEFNILAIPGLEDFQIEPPRASYLRILQNTQAIAKLKLGLLGNKDIGCIFDGRTEEVLAPWDEKLKSTTLNVVFLKAFQSWTVWENEAPIKTTYDRVTWDNGERCNPSDFQKIGDSSALAPTADNFVCVTRQNLSDYIDGKDKLQPRILTIKSTDNTETVDTLDKFKMTIIKVMQTINGATGELPRLWDIPWRITTGYQPKAVTKARPGQPSKEVSYYFIQSIEPIADGKKDTPYLLLDAKLTTPIGELYNDEVKYMNKPITALQQIAAPRAEVVQDTPPQLTNVTADTPPPPAPVFEESDIVVDEMAPF